MAKVTNIADAAKIKALEETIALMKEQAREQREEARHQEILRGQQEAAKTQELLLSRIATLENNAASRHEESINNQQSMLVKQDETLYALADLKSFALIFKNDLMQHITTSEMLLLDSIKKSQKCMESDYQQVVAFLEKTCALLDRNNAQTEEQARSLVHMRQLVEKAKHEQKTIYLDAPRNSSRTIGSTVGGFVDTVIGIFR